MSQKKNLILKKQVLKLNITIKTAFILALIIDIKVAKTEKSFLIILNTNLSNNFFYYSYII